VSEPEGTELPLEGGNTSVVVRVGDTVRRAAGTWTAATQHLLRHLEHVGFVDSPRVLGLDDRGREVLSYVPGEVGTAPAPPWFGSDDALHAAGDWLRRFHAAQSTYRPDPSLPWRMVEGRELAAGEVVCHNDVAPYNAVHRDDDGLTVIDFDFCSPGDPLLDLAFTAWAWVPLYADAAFARRHLGVRPDDVPRRLRLLADAYGADAAQRARLLGVVETRMLSHADDVEALARTEDPAFVALVSAGVATGARADAALLRRREHVLSDALRD
jgi:hypothetical protein